MIIVPLFVCLAVRNTVLISCNNLLGIAMSLGHLLTNSFQGTVDKLISSFSFPRDSSFSEGAET